MANSFWKYHLPPVLYAIVVFGLSSISGWRAPFLSKYPTDKLLHFFEYAVFALLTFRSFRHLSWLELPAKAALSTIVALTMFAGMDELYQSFIPKRRPDLYDFLTDITGVIIATGIAWAWQYYRSRRTIVV